MIVRKQKKTLIHGLLIEEKKIKQWFTLSLLLVKVMEDIVEHEVVAVLVLSLKIIITLFHFQDVFIVFEHTTSLQCFYFSSYIMFIVLFLLKIVFMLKSKHVMLGFKLLLIVWGKLKCLVERNTCLIVECLMLRVPPSDIFIWKESKSLTYWKYPQ